MDKKTNLLIDELIANFEKTNGIDLREENSFDEKENASKTEDSSLLKNENTQIKKRTKSSAIKNIHTGHRQRVREAVDTDPNFMSFSDHEVLEYILFSTLTRIDTNKIAHELIDTFGSLSGVLNATMYELTNIPYITENTARLLTSILPIARKAELSRVRSGATLRNSIDTITHFRPYFYNKNTELLYLACLNLQGRVVKMQLISEGDVSYTNFDIKKIIQYTCQNEASKVLLVHNHPSGSLSPSQADIDGTRILTTMLYLMGIELIDHYILTASDFFSFRKNGLIAIVDSYEKYDIEGVEGIISELGIEYDLSENLNNQFLSSPLNDGEPTAKVDKCQTPELIKESESNLDFDMFMELIENVVDNILEKKFNK